MTELYKNPILISVLIFKLFLIFIFSSEYSSDLFYPFLNSTSLENYNPWQSHYQKGLLDSFPYHGLMAVFTTSFCFYW